MAIQLAWIQSGTSAPTYLETTHRVSIKDHEVVTLLEWDVPEATFSIGRPTQQRRTAIDQHGTADSFVLFTSVQLDQPASPNGDRNLPFPQSPLVLESG